MTRRHQAATRLCAGAGTVVRRRASRLAGWVRGGRDRRRRLARLAVLLLAGLLAWRIVRAAPWLMWPVSAAFAIAAWRAASLSGPAADEPPSEAGPEAVRTLLHDLIGEGRGVHLSAVLRHLQEHGQGEGWEVPDLRARLGALGVPCRRSVKVGGAVAWGVHRDDLQAPPPADPDEMAA